MKKIILMLITVIAFVSCETTVPKSIIGETYEGINVQVHILDSCEYIVAPLGNGTWGSHKGNCKFCLKRNYNPPKKK